MSIAPVFAQTTITIDPTASRHPISKLIYGVCFGSEDQMKKLNFTINRQGGNNYSRYNWQNNSMNIDSDYFFESIPGFQYQYPTSMVPGERADTFINGTKAAGAEPMITIPMIGWVAKVVSPTQTLYSYSVKKYGTQQKTDPNNPDIGNGIRPDGSPITNNDPNDANVQSTPDTERPWIEHLVGKWGGAAHGGLRYYIMDNEPGLWHATHQDVCPFGPTSDQYLKDFFDYATMVKSVDSKAIVVAPEEWGWPGLTESGSDQLYSAQHHYQGHPDKDAHGSIDYMPWLLQQIRNHDQQAGHRLLDIFSFHMYPTGAEFSGPDSPAVDSMRSRSTRSFWDPTYKDENWVNDKIMMIPRMKALVDTYYPGTKIAITEYNWGAEDSMSGATAQADILGIFGREALYLATRWTVPDESTPTFKAMQMYRNYDGNGSVFGDISVADTVKNPDNLSSFAAFRESDHALTVMVINKTPGSSVPVNIAIAHTSGSHAVQVWQLAGTNHIHRLPDLMTSDGQLSLNVPEQSITLLIVAARKN